MLFARYFHTELLKIHDATEMTLFRLSLYTLLLRHTCAVDISALGRLPLHFLLPSHISSPPYMALRRVAETLLPPSLHSYAFRTDCFRQRVPFHFFCLILHRLISEAGPEAS